MQNTDSSHRQLELDSLIEFSQLINSNLNLEFILGNILLTIMGKMLITKGIVVIKKAEENSKERFVIESLKGLDQKLIGTILECDCPKIPVFTRSDLKDNIGFFDENNIEFFFKIYFGQKLLGILCLGKKVNDEKLNNEDIIFIETLLNISASSIENTLRFNEIRQLNKSLDGKLHQLRSLFELSKEFNLYFQDREKIIKLFKYTLLGNFGIKDFLILSKYKSDKFYLLDKDSKFDIDNTQQTDLEQITKATIISNDSDNNFIKHLAEKNYKLIIPMLNNGKVENLVCLGSKLDKSKYTDSDIDFLESIVNLSLMSIEKTILFNEFLEKQKIENELKIAREIQVALLPDKLPEINNYQVSAENIPALHVGGDYFDVIKLTENKFAIVIADVSGKGTPASLLMANIQSAVHSFLKLYPESDFNIADVTSKINELIYANTTAEKFITLFWGILDCKTNTFSYVNAGHNPPFHFSSDSFSPLEKGGLMVGIFDEGVNYETGTVEIQNDDIMVLYTDGVNEALNKSKEEFGEDRLKDCVQSSKEHDTNHIINNIKDNIKNFTSGTNQYDDITLIVLKKTK